MTARPILPRDWKLTLPRNGEGWTEKGQFDDLSRRSVAEHLTTIRSRGKLAPGEIGLISVVRNEAGRLPQFFKHYKKLGIDRFLMIDNDSADGSQDLLLAEPSADVFYASMPYRLGYFGLYWCNGLAHEFCHGNWVLVVDADELFVYDGMDRHGLIELGHWLDLGGFDRLLAVVLDVHPRDAMPLDELRTGKLSSQDCWFDVDGYFTSRMPAGWFVNGGANYRLQGGAFETTSPPISKYPFFRMGPATSVCNPHFIWPFDQATNAAYGALVHLKLMDKTDGGAGDDGQDSRRWAESFSFRRTNSQLGAPASERASPYMAQQRYTGPDSLVREKIISPIGWRAKGNPDLDAGGRHSRPDLAVGKLGWRFWTETIPDYGHDWRHKEEFILCSRRALREQLTVVRCRGPLQEGELGLICVMRNEVARLPLFFEHYKKLGITRFFMIDNDSQDGSHELLLAEPGADIFHTSVPFRNGQAGLYWANAIALEYCVGHWIMRADADELLVYDGMESHDLGQLGQWLRSRGSDRLFAPLLDVYPSSALGSGKRPIAEVLDQDCWFDAAGYKLLLSRGGWHLAGGVRKRLFGSEKGNAWPILSKYPFFFMSEDIVIFSHHWLWPYDTVTPGPQGALIHLKVMDDLAERAAVYSREGQHFRGSEDYKLINTHFDSQPSITAFHNQSVRYRGPKSLIRQHFMRPIDWPRPIHAKEIEEERKRIAKVRSAEPTRRDWADTFPDGGDEWFHRNKLNWISHSTLREQLDIVRCRGPLASGEIGAICVVKDAGYLPRFFEHYRKLGVARFFMINGTSDDAACDAILAEPSADLFQAHATLAEGFGGIYWANGVAREFCRDQWTIRADASELLVYDRMEEKGLSALASWLEARDHDRLFALTTDLYPSDGAVEPEAVAGQALDSDLWFDGDGYREEVRKGGWLVAGGLRRRLLGRAAPADADWLSKYPFVRMLPETTIADEHFLWPVSPRKPVLMGALLNLIPKTFLAHSAGQVHHAGSRRYDGARSLIHHGLMQPIDWDD